MVNKVLIIKRCSQCYKSNTGCEYADWGDQIPPSCPLDTCQPAQRFSIDFLKSLDPNQMVITKFEEDGNGKFDVEVDYAKNLINNDPHNIHQHEPGAKLDSQKPDASLLVDFGRALLAVSEVGSYGCKKYARGSWQHVPDGVNRYTAALIRHLLQEQTEQLDSESKLLHASHCAWNAISRLELMLREQNKSGDDQIDR